MIAPVFPEAYDAVGKRVLGLFERRRGLHPTFPMGRYVSQELTVHCQSLSELRNFLRGCKPVSDKEQFDRQDYWQPPEDFERTKKGDCDCFALWTWRRLMEMGYDARVVFGKCGRYGVGHAWVEYFADGQCFLVEPQANRVGEALPRLSTLSYQPKFSVAWDGKKLCYYQHAQQKPGLGIARIMTLIPEWAFLWGDFWLRNASNIPLVFWHATRKILKGFRWPRSGR
jgi:hypothetical protein